jgi:5-methyltetrahydrofolate corrinoid/iron sulfur protein methyltransferase
VIIIGEKINATIPAIREAIAARNEDFLRGLAADQEKAGASLIDVNVGTGQGGSSEEIRTIHWMAGLVRDAVQCNLCIDSADPAVLRAGLEASQGRAGMINSVKATEKNMEEIFPLSVQYGIPVIALAMDEKGIPKTEAGRLDACEKIIRGAEAAGVPAEHIYFDPLVMPVSTDISQGMVTLQTLRGIKDRFPGAKTVLALSNVSFGLPRRSLINIAMLQMAMFLSVDAVIINPLDSAVMSSLRAAEAVMGRDRHCRRYARAIRNMQTGGE